MRDVLLALAGTPATGCAAAAGAGGGACCRSSSRGLLTTTEGSATAHLGLAVLRTPRLGRTRLRSPCCSNSSGRSGRLRCESDSHSQQQQEPPPRRNDDEDACKVRAYGDIPNQAEAVTASSATLPQPEYKATPDIEYLQELLAMQQSGPKSIGFFGTRNMGFLHQQLIEILSYAMVITKNHIYTSGASGTNAAVIRGALRAERPDLLTVILPQSLKRQPPESQELLSKVQNVVEMPQNDALPLFEASRLCNMDILSHVQQVICFAFHDSNLLMETCREAKNLRKIVTLFYLD